MKYVHASNIDLVSSTSYKDSFVLALPNEQDAGRVRYWATREPPPSAPNQAAVRENCQAWVIRVVARLVEEGIIHKSWLSRIKEMQQPVK